MAFGYLEKAKTGEDCKIDIVIRNLYCYHKHFNQFDQRPKYDPQRYVNPL